MFLSRFWSQNYPHPKQQSLKNYPTRKPKKMNTWNRLFFGVINVGRSTAKTVGSLASLHIFEKALQLHSPGSFFLAIPPCFWSRWKEYIPLQKWTQIFAKVWDVFLSIHFDWSQLPGLNFWTSFFRHVRFQLLWRTINRWDRRFQGASAFKLQVANLAVAPIALKQTERCCVQKCRVLVFGPPGGNENNGWICLGLILGGEYPWFIISIFFCRWWTSKKSCCQYHRVSFVTQVGSFCKADFYFGRWPRSCIWSQ